MAKTTTYLSNKLHTTVEIKGVDINLFSHIILKDIYVEDLQKDTLLYAQHLEVNIGSINPFAPKVKLKDIQLHTSYINIYRNNPDTVFNYAFIADAFSSGKHDTTSSSSSFDIKLNTLDITETRFKYHDEISLNDFDVYIQKTKIDINNLDLTGHILAMEKVYLEKTDFALTTLLNGHPIIDTSYSPPNYDTIHISLGNWIIEANSLKLKQCAFYYKNENSVSAYSGINFNDLGITNIDLDMDEISYIGDSIQTTINQIALKEKSGFQLDSLSAAVIFSPYEITLNNLNIVTPNSTIKNYLAFTFSTLNDFNRIEDDVFIKADLLNTHVNVKDIAYFAPELKKYDVDVKISSNISGRISNLKIKNAKIIANNSIGLEGNLFIKGLPSIDETFLDLELKPLYANTAELENILGSDALPSQIKKWGNIKFNGRFTGFANDFVTYGTITSDMGNATTDIKFAYDKSTNTSSYSGKLNTEKFNVGELSGVSMLGNVTMNAEVSGSAQKGNVAVEMKGIIQNLEFNNYNYSNITVDGNIKDKFFTGELSVKDPNLVMNFDGSVNFSDTLPHFNFASKIDRANLKKLNLYDKDLIVSLNTNINLTGSNIDEAIGTASLTHILIIQNNKVYNFDSLIIKQQKIQNGNSLSIQSPNLQATISGNYALTKMPAAVSEMINIYLNGGALSMAEVTNAQNVEFSLHIKNLNDAAYIFYPPLHNIENVSVNGTLNTMNRDLQLRATSDYINYSDIGFHNAAIEMRTENDVLQFFARLNKTDITQSTSLPITTLEGNFSKDSLNYNLKIGHDTDSNRLNLLGSVLIKNSLYAMRVLPSEIYYDNERWEIQPNNSLSYDGTNLIADNFSLTNGDKIVSITSVPNPDYDSYIKINLKNFPIGGKKEGFTYNGYRVKGDVTASVNIGNLFSTPSFVGVVSVKQLMLDDQILGDLNISSSLLRPNNKIGFAAQLSGANSLKAGGYYVLGQDSINIDLQINKSPLFMIEPFTAGIMSNLSGDLYGHVFIKGKSSDPKITGDLNINNGGLKIDYLGTHYNFVYMRFDLAENRITIPTCKITDDEKNIGLLVGDIHHTTLYDWRFDELRLTSDHLIFMNSTLKDNSDFYGKVYGKGMANITGDINNLNIYVNATPAPNSVFNLPITSNNDVKKHDFIKFVDYSDTTTNKAIVNEKSASSVVNVDMYFNVTPDLLIKMINGEDTIKGRGYGNLHIEVNTADKFNMYGTYKITEGSYGFSFENIIKKEFTIQEGGTVSWTNGNPFKADLNIAAIYHTKARKIDMVSDLKSEMTPSEYADAEKIIPVDVYLKLTGDLETPDISFDIVLPEDKNSGSTTAFDRRMQEIQSDKNELNKQVFGLLLVDRFLPQQIGAANPVSSGVGSTVSEFISNELSSIFTDWISELLPHTSVDVGYQSYQSTDINLTDVQRQEVVLGIEQKLFNDRVTVKVGGVYNVDQSTTSTTSNTSNIAGDFEIQYNISPDGSVRVQAFRKSEYDVIGAKNDTKTGVGIFYTKNFDHLYELWRKEEKDKQEAPPKQ